MNQLSLDLYPPLDYQLLISRKAKQAALRVEPGRGLIVTIPAGFKKKYVPAFVEEHRDWIEKTLLEQWKNTPERLRQWPPNNLQLAAIGKTITLSFANYACQRSIQPGQEHGLDLKPDKASTEKSIESTLMWSMESSPEDKIGVASEISNRLKPIAQKHLLQRLAAFADLHSLRYKKAIIRGQKTLWGSYSSSGTLSLNFKLLFLNKQLVDYVLLHELAHTIHLDHSPRFWRLLTDLDINARVHDELLRDAGKEVPPWLELAC